jgi:hypothetical protein
MVESASDISSEGAAQLYLDLLKRSLTNTIHDVEPNADSENQYTYVNQFIEHYMKGPAISMLPIARMDNIEACVRQVVRDAIPGDLIETGVWRGGATIFMRGMLKALGVTDRKVWVADSFEGLPEPDAERFPKEAAAHKGVVFNRAFKHFAAGLEEVQHNFQAYGLLDDQVRFLQGWFKDTLPTAPIEQLAVIRLDGDYFESTMDALNSLYDKLAVGGFLIIDDYGEDMWTYCRQAVEEFRTAHGVTEPLVTVDSKCSYWRRTK